MNRLARAGPAAAAGWTLMEVMVAMAIVATGLLVLVQQLSISFRESTANEDRAFAFEKAAALLSEIDNAIVQGVVTEVAELQALQDATYNVVLTTRRDGEELPFAPDHPMSGNVRRQDEWAWSRRIHVLPHHQSDLQYCRVEVYRRNETGAWHLEASLAQVFSLLPDADAPEQTFDVYVLAIGAAPSAWGDLGELRTHVETAASTIALHAQAGFRLHWITRLGYGRDPCYAPYVNCEATADAAAPWSYWLPGALGGPQLGQRLYRSELLGAMHRTEAGLVGGKSATDPLPVTVADRNNHCMRAPAARELFEQRVAAGLEQESEPPLQLLLDDLVQRPERYRNAIFVNLHGSALPCPPLRNYSDAARDPAGRPGVRVVTHPARLQTPRDPNGDGDHADTMDLELRVYAYRTQGSGNVLTEPIQVRIHGGDFTSAINAASNATMRVDRLSGGVDPYTGATGTPNCIYFGFDSPAAVAPTAPEAPLAMYYEAGFVGGADPYTWLKLYNTPLVAPQYTVQGLHPDGRLYGLDYVPSPVAGSFARDLAYASSDRAMRNTARWRIRVCKRAFAIGALPDADAVVRVETTIGADAITGQRWPSPVQPLNRSETFAWWTRSSDAVPPSERAQFLGDPRLCPYSDLMVGGGPLANGYNWHFDDLRNGAIDARALWPCLDGARLQDGFAAGGRADAPRFLQLFRLALQQAGAVLVSPTGTLANELVLGGEIATAAAPASLQPVTMHADWGGTTAVDTVVPGTATGERVLARGAWWAKPWLGELFPDDLWQSWYEKGNLPLQAATPPLHWDLRHAATLAGLPYGTEFTTPSGARLGGDGCTMLVDCGDTGHTFVMRPRTLDAAPAQPAREIGTAANLVPPDVASANARIDVAGPSNPPIPAFAFTDSYPRSTATQLETLWSAGNEATAAVVAFAREPQARGFVVPWNVAGAKLPPNADVARQALLLGVRAQHAAATPSLPGRIVQLPRLEIVAPEPSQALQSPGAIELRWKTEWLRFDGHPYRAGLPDPFVESESALVYRVLVSSDDGATWTSALTQQPAQPGVWPEDPAERLADGGTGNESFAVTPADAWTEGRYLFLVEAWRSDCRMHSASHRVMVFVRE